VITNCVSGSTGQTVYVSIMINTADLQFSNYYALQISTIQRNYTGCCSICYYDPSCYVFDYKLSTKLCKMYQPLSLSVVTTSNNAAISALFFVRNADHVSGYYW
jgi:hypothetical protein